MKKPLNPERLFLLSGNEDQIARQTLRPFLSQGYFIDLQAAILIAAEA
jgi:hypothetical protein